jgi:hypothetical protein
MLLEALKQEVVDGSKVVIAAVLERLRSRESAVRVKQWLQDQGWSLGTFLLGLLGLPYETVPRLFLGSQEYPFKGTSWPLN